MLNAGGRLVTIVSSLPDNAEQRAKDAFFIVEPNQKQLLEVAQAAWMPGTLKTYVSAVVPLARSIRRLQRSRRKDKLGYGKVVIVIPVLS